MEPVNFHTESGYTPKTFTETEVSLYYRLVYKTGLVENPSQARIVLITLAVLLFALAFIIFPYGDEVPVVEPEAPSSAEPFESLI